MTVVTIHEAKTHLSRLIRRALDGEEIIIARGNQPVVRLVVIEETRPKRRIGGAPGLIVHIADDFDEPLDDMQAYMS